MNTTHSKRGISHGGPAAVRKRIANAFLIGTPLLGTVYSAFYFRSHPVSGFAIFQLLIWYLVTGLGIGVGFHRFFTHKSFQTFPAVRLILGIAGSLAFQGSVIRWIADHRRHHRYSDQLPDTHSPHRFPLLHRMRSRFRNLFHAHIGWMFDDTTTAPEVYASDLLRDPVALWLDRWYFPLTLLSLLIPYFLGYIYDGREAAFQCLLLGGCVRVTLFHNVTWAVNSIGHTWGDRPSTHENESRNNWVLAFLAFGEGWHNNHHAAPRCAYNNWRGYEFDPNGALINLLERLGIVWSVNRKHSLHAHTNET